MKLFVILLLLWPSLLLAKGINEGNYSVPMVPAVPEEERVDPIHDRPSANSNPVKINDGKSSYSIGTRIDKTNRQGEAIDVQLRDSAIDLSKKSVKLKEKARYYQKLGWATISAGGSGAYFFWKARNYRKESSKTKKIAKELFDQADKINDVADDKFNAYFPEGSDGMDPNTDVPNSVEVPDSLIGDNGKISDKDFLAHIKNAHGVFIDENPDGVTITENGVVYDANNQPKLTPQVLAMLSEEDKKLIGQGIAEQKSQEQKVAETAKTPVSTPQVKGTNKQEQLYRDFLAKQKKSKELRKPAATAAGKVVLYNGEPIGHKYDNLFDMIHRAYEKATEEGLFYPPNTRLNPDGTPRN